MNDWKSKLKADQTNWLLEEDNPSVRYFALVDLLEKSKEDPEVLKVKAEIMQKGVVPEILAKQKEEGYWEEAEIFYTAKYRGTVWQILILAQLGADGKDSRIKRACEVLLEKTQDRESNGFSVWISTKTGGGQVQWSDTLLNRKPGL